MASKHRLRHAVTVMAALPEHLRELLMAELEDGGVEVDPQSDARIRDCRELSLLQDWARRAPRVGTISELLAQ